MVEAERYSSAFYILLTDTSHDLGDVDVTSLGPSNDHVDQSVRGAEAIYC